MAHIRPLGRPGARSYQVRWVAPDRREHARTFAGKGDAERFLVSVSHSMLAGSYVDPTAGRLTFREYAETWRALQRHRESTRRNVESKLTRHVYPRIGGMQMAAIRPSDLAALRAGLTVADSTAAIILGYVASIFAAAVRDRIVAASPAVGVRTTSKPELVVPMTAGQVRQLLDAMHPRYHALAFLLSRSGMRIGEACGLSVDRFEALRRQVRIDRQLTYQAAGAGHVLSPPKTAAGRRTVPVPQSVVEVVAAHLAEYGPTTTGGVSLIFSNEHGRPVQPTVFTRGPFATAVRRAGLPESITPHDLRHFYVSALIANGESVVTVQRRVGHESGMTTLRTYGHLWADSDDRTRDAIEAAFADDLPGTTEQEGTTS